MSVFDAGGTDPDKQTKTYVEQLVEAKGDNWSDPEVMAKGKLEADERIAALETQIEGLEQDQTKHDYAKELLEQIKSQTASSGGAPTDPTNDNAGPNSGNTIPEEGELESLIESTLSKREKEGTVKRNLEQTNAHLEELFGTEAGAEVQKRAGGLSMSVEQLQSIAADSPTAFFKLIGEEPIKQETNTTVQSSVNTDTGFNRSAKRDWNYYKKLKKENPKTYQSAAVQNQLLEDRKELGDAFWN